MEMIYVFLGVCSFVLLILFLKVLEVLPLKIFDHTWKKEYEVYKGWYEQKRNELEAFKSDVYKEEIIQEKMQSIQNLQNANSILSTEIRVLRETNDVLTQVLQNRR